MITATGGYREQRPYADAKYRYFVKASGESEDEVLEYCTTKVHRASKSKQDERAWYETYYIFEPRGNDEYIYTVVEPNCD